MECTVVLEIVSEENFSTLSGIFTALRDSEMDECYELLGDLDEESVEALQAMEDHHGEYFEALDELNTEEDEGRIVATFVTGSDGEDFLRELLQIVGPHSELARGKVSDGEEEGGAGESSDPEPLDDDELDEEAPAHDDDDDDDVEDASDFESLPGSEFVYDRGNVVENS